MLFRRACFALGLPLLLLHCQSVRAQISKGFQILTNRGFQVQGMVANYDIFHLTTYSNANYTSMNWLWDSTPSAMGPAPGFPWARWVSAETNMPPQGSEGPYVSQLVTLQLGDEWELNQDAVRTRLVNWFNAVRANWPNTILFHNNYGGQVGDSQLGDFITRAQPDMLCFDTYPWRYNGSETSPGGTPIHWYGDARRFREFAKNNNIPLATYVQTYYSTTEGTRSPSPSELRLIMFGAMAFNAKTLIDFTYNTGASAFFTNNLGGDNAPNPLYYEKAEAAARARNLGKALVRLKPITDAVPNSYTTGMMFIRGKDPGGTPNPIPIGFVADAESPNSYTDWVYQRNDPYLSGWSVTNKAGTKNGGQPGDVIISWFTPLDESFDGTNYTNEIYLMVVNGLVATNGTAANCLQEIQLNFLDAFTAVEILDPLTGNAQVQVLPVVNSKRQLVLNLNGGDAALFKFFDGAPFVGAQVTGPPVIAAQPASRTNNAGTDASFSVVAAGAAPLSYRWRFNGTNITGPTTNSYTRSNVQPADAGSYTVVITNSAGSVTSTVASLTVNFGPQITTQPQSRIVTAGSNVLFTVVAAANPAPTYKWRFNGTNISGATASSYTRTNAQSSDAGIYSVLVSNTIDTALSSNAVLTVNGGPSITTQPQNQAVLAGQTASFSVFAVGSPPLSFLWRKDGSNLTNAGNIAGATNSALTVSNVQQPDLATYTVIVTNSYGSVTSAPATLTLAVTPAIQAQPQSLTNNAGSTATFSVIASGNGLSYQWQRSGTNLSDSVKIAGASTDTLLVSAITKPDAVSYLVVITNAAGSVTSAPATLTVVYPLPFHEPFNDTAGDNLGGQTSPNFLAWDDVGTNTAGPYISVQAGNLDVTNLAPASGNSILFGGLGKSARLSFPSPFTTGTVYYSFALKVLDLTGASAAGGFIAGFNNSTGPQGNQPTAVGTRVYLRSTNSGFNLGLAKNSSTSTDWAWDATVFSTSDTIFLAGSYTFTSVGVNTDDISKLWINPNPTNFGAVTTPSPSLFAFAGSDITSDQISSFVFFQRSSTVEPAAMIADELRIGTSWAAVTPGLVPLILTQPISRTNTAGTTAIFSVSASGGGLNYQWKRNGTALTDAGNISGTTTATLTLAGVTQTNAGSYTVTLTQSSGSITSAPAMLTVIDPPVILTQPSSITTNAGSTIAFGVTATGTLPLAYQWRLNGVNISGAITNTLTRTNVQSSDAGTYSVVITNSGGSITSAPAILTVNFPPQISAQPQNQSVDSASTANFSVSAAGTAPLAYQWRFNTINISGATNSSYTVPTAQRTDAGNYSVVITNIVSSVTSSNALLTVNPVLPLQIDSIAILPDGRVHLQGSGDPGYFEIQISSNLFGWTALTNVLGTNGTFEYVDLVTNLSQRYYRARLYP